MADMKSTAPRFDVATLQNLAGAGFARGEAYWREGRVRRLVCAETRVTAVVDGGEAYRMTLIGADMMISGECECPAAGTFGFCKHTLAANDGGADASGDEDTRQRIRAHLQAMIIDVLVAHRDTCQTPDQPNVILAPPVPSEETWKLPPESAPER